jgi:hypothetical protein
MQLQGGRSAQLNNNDNLFLSGNDNKMSRKERAEKKGSLFSPSYWVFSAAA